MTALINLTAPKKNAQLVLSRYCLILFFIATNLAKWDIILIGYTLCAKYAFCVILRLKRWHLNSHKDLFFGCEYFAQPGVSDCCEDIGNYCKLHQSDNIWSNEIVLRVVQGPSGSCSNALHPHLHKYGKIEGSSLSLDNSCCFKNGIVNLPIYVTVLAYYNYHWDIGIMRVQNLQIIWNVL